MAERLTKASLFFIICFINAHWYCLSVVVLIDHLSGCAPGHVSKVEQVLYPAVLLLQCICKSCFSLNLNPSGMESKGPPTELLMLPGVL